MKKSAKMKIGVLTWHYFTNFGSAMQTYALQQTIKKLGYQVKVINYRDARNATIFRLVSLCATFLRKKQRVPLFFDFQRKRFDMSKCISKRDELVRESHKYGTIIVGSDQIWAPSMFNPIYFLEFAGDDVRKVSYAASIGLDDIPDELCPQYKNFLSNFKYVSVRERVGKQTLQNKCGILSELVLDPTLLLEPEEYTCLANKPIAPNLDLDKPFVFCYFLNREHDYRNRVEAFAKENNLQIIGCSLNDLDNAWMRNISRYTGPQEYLWLFENAEYVITDSYHGTIFSLLLNKKFATLKRFAADSPVCQNSRIYQLAEYFEIGNNIQPDEANVIEIYPVDYEKFNSTLKTLKETSVQFLSKTLEACDA